MNSFQDYYYYVEAKKVHKLSGIALIADGQILLVLPSKYQGKKKMWSIPKGHIESKSPLQSAKKELQEEAGIKLLGQPENSVTINYNKNGYEKKLKAYIYYVDKKIKPGDYHKDEIANIGYFSHEEALDMVEPFQKKIINKAFIDYI